MGKGGCRHVINAQCSIFMGDKKTGAWFDCPECYEEVMGKRLDLAIIESPLTLVCKACRQLFQKDLRIFDEDDAVCPHCPRLPSPIVHTAFGMAELRRSSTSVLRLVSDGRLTATAAWRSATRCLLSPHTFIFLRCA